MLNLIIVYQLVIILNTETLIMYFVNYSNSMKKTYDMNISLA